MARKTDDAKKMVARELYVVSGLSAQATAIKANISDRTLLNWRREGKWDDARNLAGFDKTKLNENLYALAQTASRKLKENIEQGVIDSKQMNAMQKLISSIQKIEAYEKMKDTEQKPKQKGNTSLHSKVLQRMGLA